MFGRTGKREDGRTSARRAVRPPGAGSPSSRLPSCRPAVVPSFRHSILPSFHPSVLPSFHPSVLPSFHPSVLAFAPHVTPAHPEVPPPWVRSLGPRLAGGLRYNAPLRQRLPGLPRRHPAAALDLASGRGRSRGPGLDRRRAPQLDDSPAR